MYNIQSRYDTPAYLLISVNKKINGVVVKIYEDKDIIFISAKSYGGTEKIINNVYVIEDTLEIETFYREDIKSNCRIRLLDDGTEWEIINTPEIIDRRKKTLKFKVRRINGEV